MFLIYSSTKRTNCHLIPGNLIEAYAEEDNSFFKGKVIIRVKVPELIIWNVDSVVERGISCGCKTQGENLKIATGLKLGSGMTKELNNLLANNKGCRILKMLLFDCCYVAVEEVGYRLREKVQAGIFGKDEFNRTFLSKEGNRFKNSCIVFDERGSFRNHLKDNAGKKTINDLLYDINDYVLELDSRVGRTVYSSIERIETHKIKVTTNMDDMGQGLSLNIIMNWPELEIIQIDGEMRRVLHKECYDAIPQLQLLKGLRAGPGLRKSVLSVMAGPKGCVRFFNIVLDSMHAAIHGSLSCFLLDAKAKRHETNREKIIMEWIESISWLQSRGESVHNCLLLNKT